MQLVLVTVCIWKDYLRLDKVSLLWFLWLLLLCMGLCMSRQLGLLSSIILDKDFPDNLIGIKAIHTFLEDAILKDGHFGKGPDPHGPTEVMIGLVAIDLIDGYGPSFLCLQFVNDILEELAVPTPRREEL